MQVFSFGFFLFFAAVFAAYHALPRLRVAVLFAASLGFYALYGLPYTLLLLACQLGCWAGGFWLQRGPTRLRLAFCITLALAPLALFKYAGFFADLLGGLLGRGLPRPGWAQPVGISYYTFLMVSYLVDLYRGRLQAEKSFAALSASLSLFLQVTSGPLTRPRQLLAQLHAAPRRPFSARQAVGGLQLVLVGLFKKLVVADLLAYYTGRVYTDPTGFYGLSLILSAFFYTAQIYADFSGYTDMMRGLGAMLGLSLAPNFHTPYLSCSVQEFWRRWHISFSGWLTEYLYIPLGGSRVGPVRHCCNLMAVFLLSGLWHGARGSMLAWGGLHGLYMVAGRLTEGLRAAAWRALGWDRSSRPARLLRVGLTFCLVGFAWIFFGAPDLATAWYIVTHLAAGFTFSLQYFKESLILLGLDAAGCLRLAALLAALLGIDLACAGRGWRAFLAARRPWQRVAVCWGLLVALILWGNISGGAPMYFQF